MADQKSGSGRTVGRRVASAGKRAKQTAGDVVDETGSTVGRTAKGAADVPAQAIGDAAGGVADSSRGGSERGRDDSQTMRGELGSIVRETAMEILGPVMRTATRRAAKYAIQKAPELAAERLLPKLRDMGSNIEEAGGAGAFARGALSSVSESSGGLSKFKLGRGDDERGDDEDGKGAERIPLQDSIDVAVPLERAYEQFMQLDDFAELLSGGDIVDDDENTRIVWSNSEETATAVITFHRLDDRLTRVMVSFDEQPQGLAAKALSPLHPHKRTLRSDLARYKALAEMSELQREDGGESSSASESEGSARRRRGSRAEEPADEEYDEEESDEAEGEEEPIEEAEAEEEPIAAEAEEEPIDAESEEEPVDADAEYEVEDEAEPEPEPEPEPRPARRRATRRRAPGRPSKAARASRS